MKKKPCEFCEVEQFIMINGKDALMFKKGAVRAQFLGNVKCAPTTFDDIAIDEGYVVGNKWDNPELLEVKK